MKMKCSIHPHRPAVLVSGYNHCKECVRAMDREVINGWIEELSPALQLNKIKEMLSDLFGTPDYAFSAFDKLYKIRDRGPWINIKEGFKIPQKEYLQSCFFRIFGEKEKE